MSTQSFHPDPITRAGPDSGVDALWRRLRRVCAMARAALIARSVLLSAALLAAVLAGLALLDYLLRFPMALRLAALAGVILLALTLIRRWVAPAMGFSLSPTDLALEIERADPALRGVVASAVDLASGHTAYDSEGIELALRGAAIRAANLRLARPVHARLLDLRQAARAAVLFGATIGALGWLVTAQPKLSSIGAMRIMAPWSGASWPKRYEIVDTTPLGPRPVDVAVPIRAAIGSAHSAADRGAGAAVRWRVTGDDGSAISDWTRSMLVPQHRRDGSSGAAVFEQLLDVQSVLGRTLEAGARAQQAGQAGHAGHAMTLEYRLTTRDDETGTRRIALARPPRLVGASAEITLPGYARGIAGRGLVAEGTIEIAGSDAVVSPILEGSRVVIRWRFSKPVASPDPAGPGWLSSLEDSGSLVRIGLGAPDTIELELLATTPITLEPGVRDELGIPVRTPIVLALGVMRDQGPGAVMGEPERDEIVSAHAVIGLRAELSDDLGLSSGAIVAERVSGRGGAEEHETTLAEQALDSPLWATIEHTLRLSGFELATGDELRLSAVAVDLRGGADEQGEASPEEPLGEPPEDRIQAASTRSAARVLRIVDDATLIEQLRSALGPISSSLRRLDEDQARLQRLLRGGELTSSEQQRAITGRLGSDRRAVDQLARTLGRNTLDDPALESLLDDASAALGEARSQSEQAGDRIDRGDASGAAERQERVRDRMGELLSMLDRNQDSWLAIRAVEQLRDELESIRDDTGALSAKTAGRSLDEFTPEERTALERILERQKASAADAGEAVLALEERARALEKTDPTQAQALRRAAEQARASGVEEQLRRAAEQIGSNQTSSAAQTQSAVLEELDKMLEELDNAIKNRDNALRRELATIIESLKGLIAAQETEIARLGRAMGDALPDDPDRLDGLDGLDERMITLARNTLSVRDEAIGAFPETRSIADLVSSAADAQGLAIDALRSDPPDTDLASRQEQTSLLNLGSALEEARRLDDQAQQRQTRQLRDELRQAYQESLDLQTALRDESAALVGERLDRRRRAAARALSGGQSDIRATLGRLLGQTQVLNDAPIFTLAHAQLDRMMKLSADGLGGDAIERRVIGLQDASITILSSLVEVLSDDAAQDPKDFEEGDQGGSDGGSGSGGDELVIPPVAQIKLLRSMQQLAAAQTRAYSDDPASANEDDIRALSDLQAQLFEHAQRLIDSMSPKKKPMQQENPERDPAVDTDKPIERQGATGS